MPNVRQIIALGGGGFSVAGSLTLLDQYILQASKKSKPRVCFLPTASGDADNYIARFFGAFRADVCTPAYLPLFKRGNQRVEDLLLSQDVIYVGGGNTANMLVL